MRVVILSPYPIKDFCVKHFIIIQIKVLNPTWIPSYLKNVIPLVEKYEGRYLTQTSKIEMLEGEGIPPRFSLIMEFPSKEAFLDFYSSKEYQPYKIARQKGTETQMLVVPEESSTKHLSVASVN